MLFLNIPYWLKKKQLRALEVWNCGQKSIFLKIMKWKWGRAQINSGRWWKARNENDGEKDKAVLTKEKKDLCIFSNLIQVNSLECWLWMKQWKLDVLRQTSLTIREMQIKTHIC